MSRRGGSRDASSRASAEVAEQVGRNLKRWRRARGMSLDKLATVTGVSRAALSQIETSRANPTVDVLCRIAAGLAVPLQSLIAVRREAAGVLRRSDTRVVQTADGTIETRPLTPLGATAHAELYEVRLAPLASCGAASQAVGAKEILVVVSGQLHLRLGIEDYDLGPGDSIAFEADRPHVCENRGATQSVYHELILHEL
jgi:transcriptional regulator with XRE-family HTH domain